MRIKHISIALALCLMSFLAMAAQPQVGRKAASQYFEKDAEMVRQVAGEPTENMLMLHLGTYINSQAYQWTQDGKLENVGKANYGVTYLFTDWHSIDVNIRGDFSEYKINDQRAVKLSFLPLLTFPQAETHFPLYFGLGAGAGVFFQQASGESSLSLDYQLVAGARFMDLFDTVGMFAEFGLKNHIHILSDGQFNGTVFSAGAIFHF